MQPRPGEVICDPACGTGGFLLAAHDFIRKHHKLHFTLKKNPLKRADLDDFVAYYSARDRTERKERERWKPYIYDEQSKRNKANLDLSDSETKR